MEFMAIVLIVLVVLVILLYILYAPIPAGYSQPLKLQIIYSTTRVIKLASALGEKLGYGPKYVIYRKIMHRTDQSKKRRAEKDESLIITDTLFDDVPVRVYSPKDKPTMSTGLVYFHGGGGITGSVDSYDGLTRRFAKKTNAVVVSVEYRLAPEHIFPAAFDDCVRATKSFLKNAADFGVDPTRVGVGGDSAGGNLAAAVTLKLRDDNFSPKVKLQVLIYPWLQALDRLTPSYQQNQHDTMLGKNDGETSWPYYAQGHARNGAAIMRNEHTTPEIKKRMSSTYMDVKNLPQHMIAKDYVPPENDYGDENLFKELQHILMSPYGAPLIADDLSNLPKAYVFTGHNDMLRDDGFWYVHRLEEAGVEVHHRHSEIAFHGILNFHDILPEGSEYTREIIDYLRKNL